MQRWDFGPNDSMMTPQETGRFYLASDVDACFGDLARALSRCSQQMGALSKETARYSETAATAMIELGEALIRAICKKNPHTGDRELIENSAAETAQFRLTERVKELEKLLQRVVEWEPAMPAEATLIDDIHEAIRRSL